MEFWHHAVSMFSNRVNNRKSKESELRGRCRINRPGHFCGEDLLVAFTRFQRLSLWKSLEVRKNTITATYAGAPSFTASSGSTTITVSSGR
jgi:hypothetical protein